MPRCPADLLRLSPRILVFFSICLLWCPECLDTHSFLCRFLQDFSCARIVSTNSALPGNSRLFPLRLYCVINFFFWCAFLCIFALFPSCVCRVKKLFFARIFSNFPPAHYRVAKLFLFHFSQHSANKTLFCAHFCAFHVFSPLLPFT